MESSFCNVWGLANAGSIVFVMSGNSRALEVFHSVMKRTNHYHDLKCGRQGGKACPVIARCKSKKTTFKNHANGRHHADRIYIEALCHQKCQDNNRVPRFGMWQPSFKGRHWQSHERWKYCICSVWKLTRAGSIVFVMSGASRTLEVLYL